MLKKRLAQFGPGLLYAGAAVGVSHLVQSTRAGAEFGFQLLIVVIVINLIKYPVFEAGPRYAAATGTSLLDGYARIGKWAVWVYLIMSVLTMFIIMAAISIVTAGLFAQLLEIQADAQFVACFLLFLSVVILGFGQYSTLDKLMKFIVILLTISTLAALIFASLEPSIQLPEFATQFDWGNRMHVLFLAALIGWMPAPIDISIWHSMWSVSKFKERGEVIPLKTVLLDFKIGYWGTTFLAVAFVGLGALVLYGTGQQLEEGSVGFAGQLINMYTSNLGQWAFPFIALAAFTTMFSTLLTCLDAFPRTLRRSSALLFDKLSEKKHHSKLYWFWIILTALGTSFILLFFLSSMRSMVDLATTMSFVIAPVLAVLNYIALNGKTAPMEGRQPIWLRIANIVSIALLTAFSLWFLYY
ncbi:MAG: Nramp family divalent metal transporter [Flavobacteriales bacterium]